MLFQRAVDPAKERKLEMLEILEMIEAADKEKELGDKDKEIANKDKADN
jgi:hypothetical protein